MPLAQLRPDEFKSTVVAVPPIALTATLRVAHDANRKLARHIAAGGIRIILYGGNANLYHFGLDAYAEALATMASVQSYGPRVITSIGPDFGKALDQVPYVARSGLSNVMLLPVAFPSDPHGVGTGVRRIVERLGHGIILYIKREGYVLPATLRSLVDEGAVRFVKYAVERDDPSKDPYLDSLLAEIGPDLVASGMGEKPIADHIGKRRLATFSSGAVCIAPKTVMRLLHLYQTGKFAEAEALQAPFVAFELIRSQLGGIQVLHDAVSATIANMGPLMPMVSSVDPRLADGVRSAASVLVSVETEVAGNRVTACH